MNKNEISKLKKNICDCIDSMNDDNIDEYYKVGDVIKTKNICYILFKIHNIWMALNIDNGNVINLDCGDEYITQNQLEYVFGYQVRKIKLSYNIRYNN